MGLATAGCTCARMLLAQSWPPSELQKELDLAVVSSMDGGMVDGGWSCDSSDSGNAGTTSGVTRPAMCRCAWDI